MRVITTLATIKKCGSNYQAQLCVEGQREAKIFSAKREAHAWVVETGKELISGKGQVPYLPFSALLERYRDEVSTTQKGECWERPRIGLLPRDPTADVKLATIGPPDCTSWHDHRLKAVSTASVRREFLYRAAASSHAASDTLHRASQQWPSAATRRVQRTGRQDIELIHLQDPLVSGLQENGRRTTRHHAVLPG